MKTIVNTATTVVATGLLWLTLKGAYALTGSVPITLVLGALVVVQWAAARRALLALRGAGSRWRRAGMPALVWLAAASITVSFVGAELFEMFAARGKAESHFETAQSLLRQRARELQQVLNTAASVSQQYTRHARQMAEREERFGGSCLAGRGPGPGEIRAFRRMDAAAAAGLAEQLEPELAAAAATLRTADALRFNQDVPALRRAVVRAVDDLNALRVSPMWPQVLAFVDAQQAAAGQIQIGSGSFRCDDAVRQLMLTQLQRSARSAMALLPLASPQLLDHTNSREIAQATLVRTWAVGLGLLPRSLWGGRPLVDEPVRQRYGLDDSPAVLGINSLPLLLAWVLEFVLIALLMLAGGPQDGTPDAGAAARLRHWAGARLRQRPGLLGELAHALTGAPDPSLSAAAPYIDRRRLFADDAMEERAWTVAPWYRPWGARDIVAVPLSRYLAVRAARELWRAGLLRRLASGIPTAQLMRDRRLADIMEAVGGPVPESLWEVYQVADEHLARWLLTQPVEARSALVGVST